MNAAIEPFASTEVYWTIVSIGTKAWVLAESRSECREWAQSETMRELIVEPTDRALARNAAG
jgi:hypothetical protein